MLTCSKCVRDLPDDAFHMAKRNTGRRCRASWCKDCTRVAVRDHHRRNPDTGTHRKQRVAVIAILGGRCVRCGIDDPIVLQVDHTDGGGREERRVLGSQYAVYARVLKHPDEYQLLCANDHARKTYEEGDHLAWRNGQVTEHA